MSSRLVTERRLEEALKRLLNNEPTRVKKRGKLTLNRINNEAGLGNSYIHKFPEFVERVRPVIEEFNARELKLNAGTDRDTSNADEVERLKAQLKKEKQLKERYRRERDDAVAIQKELEQQNSIMMFRLFELQEEQLHNTVVAIKNDGDKQ